MEQARAEEKRLRRGLGIPEDAERVLVFSESSHWDPDWLYTADEYFERFVRKNLDLAIEELQREPRRVYSVECVFFLRMYWDRCPGKRESIRGLANKGQLRLTSTGVTTADTLIPATESILRDLLIGQEWLRTHGIDPEPSLAYFADSFGCTPALPSILRAAGFDRTALTRIDGMYFPGCDIELPSRFPKPGSSADLLLNRERSLDFFWRDSAGAEVLCHWNAYTYGQGDMLAFAGLTRIYLAKLAIPLRLPFHISRRIAKYVKQLGPFCRTPYMLCPIGFDFVEPIPDLLSLLDGYNREYYPETGVWTVNAGIDDYLSLVETHRHGLPVIELDPNPYWTGFYTSRPSLKQRAGTLVHDLLLCEKLSFLPENKESRQTVAADLSDAWWKAAVSNHHDFVTGTSPDKVAEGEQIPWLDEAIASARAVRRSLSPNPTRPEPVDMTSTPKMWDRRAGVVQIRTKDYSVEMDENTGGCISSLRFPDTAKPLADRMSNDLASYRDSGGLWRMGYEFAGGRWNETDSAGRQTVPMRVIERGSGVEIESKVKLKGRRFLRTIRFDRETPVIYGRIEGKAAEGHSVIVRINTGIFAEEITMDTPGGVVVRPPAKIYETTFWPLHRFAYLHDEKSDIGIAVFLPMPGAVHYRPDGRIELMAVRNATRETAFGCIKLPANPAAGHERDNIVFEYALLFTRRGSWRYNGLQRLASGLFPGPLSDEGDRTGREKAGSVITTDNPDVEIIAIKPASRGRGMIVRLSALVIPRLPIRVSARYFDVTGAFLCDSRERDLRPLEVKNGGVQVNMEGTITTIRLMPS